MSDAGRDGTLTNENASELLREAINDGFNAAVRSPKEHPWSDVDFIAEVLINSQWLAGVIAEKDQQVAELSGQLERTEAQIHEPGGFIDESVDQRARAEQAEAELGDEKTLALAFNTAREIWKDKAERAEAKLAAVQQLLDDANEAATSRPYDLVDNLWRNALTRALAGTEQEEAKG